MRLATLRSCPLGSASRCRVCACSLYWLVAERLFCTPLLNLVAYHYAYTRYLVHARYRPMHILEIGLGCNMGYGPGASLKLWKAYLPCTKISYVEYNKLVAVLLFCVERVFEPVRGTLAGARPACMRQAAKPPTPVAATVVALWLSLHPSRAAGSAQKSGRTTSRRMRAARCTLVCSSRPSPHPSIRLDSTPLPDARSHFFLGLHRLPGQCGAAGEDCGGRQGLW